MIAKYINTAFDRRFVYVMLDTGNGKLKIGISKNPNARMEDIDRDTKGNMKMLMYRKLIDAGRKEKRMHRFFKAWHSPNKTGTGKTEFFQIPFFLRWTALLMLWYLKIEQQFLLLVIVSITGFAVWQFFF